MNKGITLAKGKTISPAEIPSELQSNDKHEFSFGNLSLAKAKQKAIDDIEKKYLVSLLLKYKGHVTKIAEDAGMTRRNIHRLLKRHNVDPNAWR